MFQIIYVHGLPKKLYFLGEDKGRLAIILGTDIGPYKDQSWAGGDYSKCGRNGRATCDNYNGYFHSCSSGG